MNSDTGRKKISGLFDNARTRRVLPDREQSGNNQPGETKFHRCRTSLFSRRILLRAIFAALPLFASCSFDYGPNPDLEQTKPDIVMEDIEYVRVRGGDPLVRFKAEHAERWEDRNVMELKNFTFEQMEGEGETVNASGRAGSAVVQLGSGDISLDAGVSINIESEDIEISTGGLTWNDKEKLLAGDEKSKVDIQRSDGTNFSGRGFSADARNRTWTFLEEIRGTYVEEEDDDDDAADDGDKDRTSETGDSAPGDREVDSGGADNGDDIPAETALPAREQPPFPQAAEEK